MKTMGSMLALTFSPLLLIGSNQQAPKPASIFQSFVMTVSEDGKEQADWFELWELTGEFGSRTPTCSIQVASFVLDDETRVHLWSHKAQRVTEARPGIFRVEMSGRLNPSSDVEVIIEINEDRTRVIEMSASMRSGSRGQSVVTFRVDRNNETRKLPPLRNPSWSLEKKWPSGGPGFGSFFHVSGLAPRSNRSCGRRQNEKSIPASFRIFRKAARAPRS